MSLGRTLTVACYGGLANRLRVLTSALVMAQATDRTLTMHWHRLATCGAAFSELFSDPLPVVSLDDPPAAPLPVFGGPLGRGYFDVLTASEPHLALSAVSWLALPEVYPGHGPLLAQCGAVLAALQPVPLIASRLTAFRQQSFRPQMIGVHLRRGDFHRTVRWSVDNTQSALTAVRRCLNRYPEAGIFLSTDDGGVDPVTKMQRVEGARAKFQGAFGQRVVWTEPRSLDRADPAAVQDALVDLLLLRACDSIVGTWDSSFSELAAFGRGVPLVMCRSGGLVGVVDRLGQAAGVWPVLNRLARRTTGGRANAFEFIRHLRRWPRHLIARLLRRYAPTLFERVRPRARR